MLIYVLATVFNRPPPLKPTVPQLLEAVQKLEIYFIRPHTNIQRLELSQVIHPWIKKQGILDIDGVQGKHGRLYKDPGMTTEDSTSYIHPMGQGILNKNHPC